ncbi:unnamed protein product [Oikopleura dioica]|uniref:Uncharacterized protein n=1 Tax=Oikopleura dioica TaxID=34765 RepID=E4YC42_OIKDI|nr:unnamed protein product [Oikopleura dioica]
MSDDSDSDALSNVPHRHSCDNPVEHRRPAHESSTVSPRFQRKVNKISSSSGRSSSSLHLDVDDTRLRKSSSGNSLNSSQPPQLTSLGRIRPESADKARRNISAPQLQLIEDCANLTKNQPHHQPMLDLNDLKNISQNQKFVSSAEIGNVGHRGISRIPSDPSNRPKSGLSGRHSLDHYSNLPTSPRSAGPMGNSENKFTFGLSPRPKHKIEHCRQGTSFDTASQYSSDQDDTRSECSDSPYYHVSSYHMPSQQRRKHSRPHDQSAPNFDALHNSSILLKGPGRTSIQTRHGAPEVQQVRTRPGSNLRLDISKTIKKFQQNQ